MKHTWERIINTYFEEKIDNSTNTVMAVLSRCRRCGRWRNERTIKRGKDKSFAVKTFGNSPGLSHPSLSGNPAGECRDIKLDLDEVLSKHWYRKRGGRYRKIKLGRLNEAYILDQWGEWINVVEKYPALIVFDEYFGYKTFTIDAARIIWHSLSPGGDYLTEEQLNIKDVIK